MRLFDLHCDTLTACCDSGQPLSQNQGHIDWERGCRLEEWRQVFAVWTPDTLRGEAAWRRACRTLRYAREQAQAHPAKMTILQNAADLASVRPHQCGAILALEGGAALAGEVSRLREVADRGVRLITLTWNGENEWGYGCGCDADAGLKPAGREAVGEMERLGILPDVSHLNHAGFWDVAALTDRPFIASHSVSAALHPHPRNLTDDQFTEICRRGGLVGLNLCEDQLGGLSFEQIERHLDHFLCLGGEGTLAFGCDLDGTRLPADWAGIAVMPRLYEHLCRKNYEEDLLERVFFSNCNDFFSKALAGFDK